MSGRTTPPGSGRGPDDELPPLRRRSPVVYWVVLLILAGLVASMVSGIVVALFG